MKKEMDRERGVNKKGLSPVVATVLLIALVVILAILIFLWARMIIPEKITKFGSPIEDACKDVNFDAAYSGSLAIVNKGNVPIYGIEVKKSTGVFGRIKTIANFSGGAYITKPGADTDFGSLDGVNTGDKITVVPVLLGAVKDDYTNLKAFACGTTYGKTVTI